MRPEELADGALAWLLRTAIPAEGGGLAWPDAAGDPQLYNGTAGIVVAMLEAYHHFGDDRYADAAVRAARTVAAAVDDGDHDGLYFGLTGMAFALHSVADLTPEGRVAGGRWIGCGAGSMGSGGATSSS
jgi:lantibiotic modifying enzyme